MKFIKKEDTLYHKKYRFLGIKITVKKTRPSNMSVKKKVKTLKRIFFNETGYELNLSDPHTFNEKINWLKLFYRDDLMTKIVDKYEFKNYIRTQIGDGYTVPLLGAWDRVEDIDFDQLPNKFVLKCNAQSDGKFIKIIHDKTKLNIEALKREMQNWLKPDFTLKTSYCWAYHNVPLKIIAEEYIEQIDGQVYDYKFMCYWGEPKFVLAICDRENSQYSISYYDTTWNKLDVKYKGKKVFDNKDVKKPENFSKMLEISEVLSKNFPLVRVDFYEIDSKILLGEMTFYPTGGYGKYEPREWDQKAGEWLDLSNIAPERLSGPKKYVASMQRRCE
ncbi:MAG: glycosyl transferase [Lentisphaeria bacterium]|nr:glycosyl transferase [Lentisphaeria bacterium]